MQPDSRIFRILDANLNRLREGIRVLEDIFRFLYDDQHFASRLKEIRHLSRMEGYDKLLQSRDIINDCLRETTASEASRENIDSILLSNFKRTQESARVLEESVKLLDSRESEKFKQIRYTLYDLEKEAFTKIQS